jgi:hypothetical protein
MERESAFVPSDPDNLSQIQTIVTDFTVDVGHHCAQPNLRGLDRRNSIYAD